MLNAPPVARPWPTETASALPSPQSAAPAPLAPRPIVPPPAYPEPFAGRCLAMVDKVITALGGPKDAAALGFTVAVDAKLVPDYYTIVRNPIHLGEIRGRLRKSAYADPSGFYQVGGEMAGRMKGEGGG